MCTQFQYNHGVNHFRFMPLLALAALGGCISAAPIAYDPGPLPTPWEGKKPKLFLARFTDRTGGFMVAGAGAFNAKAYAVPKGLEKVAKEALEREFERLGIELVKSPKDADAQVQVVLKKANATWDAGLAVQDRATLEMTFSVKDKSGRVIHNDEVYGNGLGTTRHPGCCAGKGPYTALSDALAKCMEQIEDLFVSGDLSEQIFAAGSAQPAAAVVASAQMESDVDDLPKVSPGRRKAHAVVIGVERYRQQLPAADFAASDARLVAKYLTKVLGYPAENVVTLTNDGASRGDIEKYLGQWLKNRVEPGDEVFVYYSGHGSPNPVTGDGYLVPYDGDPTYLDQTGYPLKNLYAQLGELPASEVTVVLDSCFSGAGGRSVLAKGARPLVTAMAKPALPKNVRVLSAAAGNQISQTYQDKGHGLFTYFFLKGLAQQAIKGETDIKRVYEFAAPQVSKVARQEYNTEQAPQWQSGAQ